MVAIGDVPSTCTACCERALEVWQGSVRAVRKPVLLGSGEEGITQAQHRLSEVLGCRWSWPRPWDSRAYKYT